MSSNKTLHFSNDFVISCGTVTVDTSNAKVLIIRVRKTGEYLLPKGRKDIGETLEQTAIRETFEETGFQVKLLPLPLKTRATLPSHIAVESNRKTPILSTEPIAVTQRVTNRHLKIIYWYAATGHSTAKQQENTQQDGEDFDAVWAEENEVSQLLSFDDDRQIVERVLQEVHKLEGGRGEDKKIDVKD